MEFQNQKTQRLGHVDLSRKGSVDEPIIELVNFINSLPNYFTTSSCSGRIIVFENSYDEKDKDSTSEKMSVPTQSKAGKKGCKWLFVSHSKVTSSMAEESLHKVHGSSGNAVFKFEAMVMHIQCKTLEDAQQMHQAAMAAGFRNSGISIGGKKKIIVGVRSTHGLEAPLNKDGVMLVTPEYFHFLVECANQKMEENLTRINRYFENVKLLPKDGAASVKDKRTKAKKDVKVKESQKHLNDESNDYISLNGSHLDGEDDENEMDELSLFLFENT